MPAATTTSIVAATDTGIRLVSAASQPLATMLERMPSQAANPNAMPATRRSGAAPSRHALCHTAARNAITTAAQIARKTPNDVEEAG